jgi:hypothetical protein
MSVINAINWIQFGIESGIDNLIENDRGRSGVVKAESIAPPRKRVKLT